MTRIKICGITGLDDALAALAAGADALGFVFAASPRRVSPAAVREIVARLPPLVVTVGVFRDDPVEDVLFMAEASAVDAVQLHGAETPADCARLGGRVIKRFAVLDGDDAGALAARMAPYAVSARLLDPGAGSGRAFRWTLARGLAGPLIVAGGLTPDNVAQAVRDARPYGVDVCSGVESAPGRKCEDRMRAFVRAVRSADVVPDA